MEYKVVLTCGHVVNWSEDPFTPSAVLPRAGDYAWCAQCEGDQEVASGAPVLVAKRHLAGGTVQIIYDVHRGWIVELENQEQAEALAELLA